MLPALFAGLPGHATPPWRFVSVPDFINTDVGDLTALPPCPAAPACDDGGENSWTPSWDAALDYALDTFLAEGPDIVFVAGDLVEGEWDEDDEGRQIFGPVSSQPEREAAIEAAGDFYYGAWKSLWTDRGFALSNVFPLIGDHEVGDDPWGPGKRELVPTWKRVFRDHFTHQWPDRPASGSAADTAYAATHKNLRIVSLDLFRQDTPLAAPSRTTDPAQDSWLSAKLAQAANDASIDWIIVQGHLPFASYNGTVRGRNSSGLMAQNLTDESAWQIMTGVPELAMYMCGEHHAATAIIDDGLLQLCHGMLIGWNMQANYLVGTVFPDRIELELKMFYMFAATAGGRLWQTAGPDSARPSKLLVNPRAPNSAHAELGSELPLTIGRATIRRVGSQTHYTDRWGVLEGPYFRNGSWDGSLTSHQLDGSGAQFLNFPSAAGWPNPGQTWDWKHRGNAFDVGILTHRDDPNVSEPPDGSWNWGFAKCVAGTSLYQRVGVAAGSGARYRVSFALGDMANFTFPASVNVMLWSNAPPGAGTLQHHVTLSNGFPSSGGAVFSVTLDEALAAQGADLYVEFDPSDHGPGCVMLLDSAWIDRLGPPGVSSSAPAGLAILGLLMAGGAMLSVRRSTRS